jgi:predicted AAA+ superfamily ATPase
MFQFLKDLVDKKLIKYEQIVFIDFSIFSDENVNYQKLISDYKQLYPDLEPFFVFDEVQEVKNLRQLVLGIYNL